MHTDYTQLQLVEEALEKVPKGTYGICEGCEKHIPVKRLNAVPWAKKCIKCAEVGNMPASVTVTPVTLKVAEEYQNRSGNPGQKTESIFDRIAWGKNRIPFGRLNQTR